MEKLNSDLSKQKNTGLTTALQSMEAVHAESSVNLTELIRSGRVTREELSAAIELMDKEKRRQAVLSRHKQAVFQGKDGRWRTTVRKPDGTRQDIRKPTREQLDDFLVHYYDHADDHKGTAPV